MHPFNAEVSRLRQCYNEKVRIWIKALRQAGVKAAHPDDGWINRLEGTFYFCYPYFDDGYDVGDVVALGTPDKYRLVTITGWNKGIIIEHWKFEEIKEPQHEERNRNLWHRLYGACALFFSGRR